MKKSIIILIAVFCICSISLNIVNYPVGNAVSYYNWIMGSDMETTTNFIEDNGFESGAFNSGVEYGNWSQVSGTSVFDSTAGMTGIPPHSGAYCLDIAGDIVKYNFTDDILGSDIEEFYWYGINEHGAGSYDVQLVLYYTDDTNSGNIEIAVDSMLTWNRKDALEYINDVKYLDAFTLYGEDTGQWIDDFFLGVEDEYSQEQYDYDTYPWRTTGLSKYWQQIGYIDFGIFTYIPFFPFETMPIGGYIDVDMIGHNLIWGRNSNGSGYIGYDESTAQFIQDINYLDSDSVHYVDLWAYTENSGTVGVKVNLIYSDRTFDTKTINLTVTDEWEHLNYGGAWIDDDKYIIQIQIQLSAYFAGYVNIDDIGLWSSLPSNMHRFTYSLSPSAIRQTFISFDVYQSQTYTFTGYLWDINGDLTENGTVTVSHNYGSTTATLSNGIFSFTINPRTATGDFTEQMGISVNTGEVIEYYELTVNWKYVSGGGGADDEEERAGNLIDWITMFCVTFLPAILFGGALYENNQQPDAFHISPVYGVMAGLVMSIGIGVYTALVPVWLLILMIVAIGILILGMVKSN